ncbi:hypothetical protein [Desulfotomaculum copahuensis]|uniref:HepT-like domain-containing protein n=1 Tax=Desulfotomaculum copahuensis TaxID=1838280 RepID=A0A1B7LBH7_9FIRM|nr:hypothetical protein [Desulfotomaculum copahuensis]OAT79818.1 hypothetical protein A6M21_15355 [Desulfotomaculum copahuensis]
MTAETAVLEARIRQELRQLDKLSAEMKKALKPFQGKEIKNTVILRALGSMLHDFYTGVEKIFLNIAKEIDQLAPRGENWHRQLLEQMTLHLKERRPAVIDLELAGQLEQYLAFRHRFRNLYGFDLEWGRMEQPVKELPETLRRFGAAVEDFLLLLMEADQD